MTDGSRSTVDERSCAICGVQLGKFGLRHSKKHTCHTCQQLVCAKCSPHLLPDSVTGKPARACGNCWEQNSAEAQVLKDEVTRLAALVQEKEDEISLIKSEVSAHAQTCEKLKTQLTECKAAKKEAENLAKDEISRIKSELDTHLQTCKSFITQLETCTTERNELQKQVTESRETLQKAEKRYMKITEKYAKTESELQDLKSHMIPQMQSQIQSLNNHLAVAQASVPSEGNEKQREVAAEVQLAAARVSESTETTPSSHPSEACIRCAIM